MIRKLKRALATFCICILLSQVAYAKENVDQGVDEQNIEQQQLENNQEQAVEITDEDVPLGLSSQAQFERYKRDVVVMIIFGGMVVLITVAATVKEKYERKKLN